MIAVIQRVSKASVTVESRVTGTINQGLVVLLGVEREDTRSQADYILKKIIELRIFNDDNGRMNRSLNDVNGSLLIISQFTLLADCRKGRRPSFNKAAEPAVAEELYEYVIAKANEIGVNAQTGIFGAMMDVSLVNDGPVTIMLDSRKFHGERLPIVQ